jgi:hypothetical protein
MPHTNQLKAKHQRLKRRLEKQLKNLTKLKQKHFKNARTVTLPQVSLGDLRKRWTLVQHKVHPAVLRQVPKFTRVPSDPDQPLLIYGSDGGLLAARVRLNKPDLIQNLSDTIDALPKDIKHYKFKGVKRGDYQTRHLGIWASYMTVPQYTAEHREKMEAHDKFLQDNKELFHHMTGLFGQLAPGPFKEFMRYPLAGKQDLPCGGWASCVVNDGGNNPNQTCIHRDVKESRYGYSCVVSCGNYTGGDIILYELGHILEIVPGDLLMFPDSLINHNNEPAVGVRKSVVTFTQENVFDYWHRTYRMVLKKHIASAKRKEKRRKEREIEKNRKRLERMDGRLKKASTARKDKRRT